MSHCFCCHRFYCCCFNLHCTVLSDDQGQVEVYEGAESVILPCKTSADLPEDATVEWTLSEPDFKMVHLFPNTTKNQMKQDKVYRSRTEMNEDLLKTGDVSLTLKYPTVRDSGSYICTVYRGKDILRQKVVLQLVKGQCCRYRPKVSAVGTGQRSVL